MHGFHAADVFFRFAHMGLHADGFPGVEVCRAVREGAETEHPGGRDIRSAAWLDARHDLFAAGIQGADEVDGFLLIG